MLLNPPHAAYHHPPYSRCVTLLAPYYPFSGNVNTGKQSNNETQAPCIGVRAGRQPRCSQRGPRRLNHFSASKPRKPCRLVKRHSEGPSRLVPRTDVTTSYEATDSDSFALEILDWHATCNSRHATCIHSIANCNASSAICMAIGFESSGPEADVSFGRGVSAPRANNGGIEP
jgi:hypothetical protein